MNKEEVMATLDKNGGKEGSLIAILEDIQARYSYLPREALELVAQLTDRSLVDIYGVATFYKAFSLEPRGKHLISVCLGTACHVRNSPRIAEEFERQLGVQAGQTTEDREFTLVTVNCLGACALGPVVVVDGHYYPQVSTLKVKEIINEAQKTKFTVDKDDPRYIPVEVSCSRCNHSLMDHKHLIDGHSSIWVTTSYKRDHGWLRLSSLYGSFHVESAYEIPDDAHVNFFCPHCHAQLIGASPCPECQERMVPMHVRGGGVVQICPRRGCKGHHLDLA